ncbi:ABC transporter permease [Aerococcus agrisoli]|uniref:ABC transporter permease n=1 Tax=Aerococcus agrisoli TaxID=2487350 RepID=A0A3N4GBG5_9LACT|nr:ABC transporter permease [Aerococcus agrisoli]RPA55900.1 ABC transporter permease [Aerococcus agrisoli]
MKKSVFISTLGILVLVFLLLPLCITVITSFGTASTIQFPIKGFTLDWFLVVFQNEAFKNSMIVSLIIGFSSVIVALIIGIPVAYFIARGHFKGKEQLNQFFLSPSIIPGMVIGYVMFQVISAQLNLPIFLGLFISHLIISLPYVIRVVGASLTNFDESIEEAAWTLGMTRGETFIKIVLPNIKAGLLSAFLMAFINSFNNIPVSLFLTGPGVSTLPITLMSYLEFNYDPSVSALSTLLMFLTIIIMLLVEKLVGISTNTQTNA